MVETIFVVRLSSRILVQKQERWDDRFHPRCECRLDDKKRAVPVFYTARLFIYRIF